VSTAISFGANLRACSGDGLLTSLATMPCFSQPGVSSLIIIALHVRWHGAFGSCGCQSLHL